MTKGWEVRVTRLTDEYSKSDWAEQNPDGIALALYKDDSTFILLSADADWNAAPDTELIWFGPGREDTVAK